MRKQESPFTIQIEFTEGCNLYCDYCGLCGIRDKKTKDYKFMTPILARSIAQDIAGTRWNPRIEFAMHGEPTMNPKATELIRIFRTALPRHQLMMTSNGGGLLKGDILENIQSFFDAGLNILAIDMYEYVKIGEKIRKAINSKSGDFDKLSLQVRLDEYDFDIYEYPHVQGASPHRRWPKNTKAVVLIEDISKADEGVHATLNNHCGGGMPLDDSAAGKRCAKPFREMSIRWNGKVALCCNDFRGVYKCGSVVDEPIEHLWNNKFFKAARKFLYNGMRDFNPCEGCNALSYRVGLLPDKKGVENLSRPNKLDKEVVTEAISGRPYTKPVKREWEK